jgi:predicted transcriptional regulator
VLRAVLWWSTGNADRSTRVAARIGQGVALFFILIGIWQFISGAGLGGLWIALIGWFLFDAASLSYAQVEVTAGLRGLRVRDIMADDCLKVDGRTSIQMFVDEHLLRSGRRCFMVEENGRMAGLVTPSDMKLIDRQAWPSTPITAVMRPLDRLRTVTPETPVIEAIQIMGQEDLNQLPVISDGRLRGTVSRSQIFQVLQVRAELSM